MRADVLIIEDQEKIARLVRDYLEADGLVCQWRRSGHSLDADLRALTPRLVILDLMLPGPDGLTLCRQIRAQCNLPIIMLTARVEEAQRLDGFSAGADDYVCKPFSPRELVARVKAVLARTGQDTATSWSAGPLTFDDERLMVSGPLGIVSLSAQQYRLLSRLARHPGQIFSRDRLMDACHQDGRALNERTIDSHIRTLRHALRDAVSDHSLIETVYGAGYRYQA